MTPHPSTTRARELLAGREQKEAEHQAWLDQNADRLLDVETERTLARARQWREAQEAAAREEIAARLGWEADITNWQTAQANRPAPGRVLYRDWSGVPEKTRSADDDGEDSPLLAAVDALSEETLSLVQRLRLELTSQIDQLRTEMNELRRQLNEARSCPTAI